MSNRVFVLDKNKNPLMPCHPARARELLTKQKAAVYRRFPFTILLKDREGGETRPTRLKFDPGSKITGMAIVIEAKRGPVVVFAAEIEHRGLRVKAAMESRVASRRSRRARKTRYRAPRFDNRTRLKGWLPPSLESRVGNITTWTAKLRRFCPITALSMELVRFDLQKEENPEISGVEYQQGTLAGYEVREYLLEKWRRECAYCGKTDIPLQVEHIHPRSKGGTDRVSNLALACESCNTKKGNRPIEEFLAKKRDLLIKIFKWAKAPLRDAAAVNSTRWTLFERLKATGLPVECGSGGRTKFNRMTQRYPKSHWIDAACVGASGAVVRLDSKARFLAIKATGRGRRQACQTDKYGFPKQHRARTRKVRGFQTGDVARATFPAGKFQGAHTGRVTVRASGSFNLTTEDGLAPKGNVRYFQMLHRFDGYSYFMRGSAS